ncbi:hypothetical protein Aca07nite_01160 [Actinoplanes capillaceus]|uniref:Motility protein n=1 Tax=Actinoplanes campanulatus TaxID=113559 RepID=A0ABQ3W715_9ACTN|nr:hypothetical protein [Actinoplanes capillaceus]GID42841.1 hypothetical protein Aca07nite_01160 [Actinoplanes capillaceus]
MSVGSIGPVAFSMIAPGQLQDPQARQEQVNAQADLLQAMVSSDLPMKMVQNLGDGKGVDLYL